jgi:hypothetical protein
MGTLELWEADQEVEEGVVAFTAPQFIIIWIKTHQRTKLVSAFSDSKMSKFKTKFRVLLLYQYNDNPEAQNAKFSQAKRKVKSVISDYSVYELKPW